MAKTHEFKGFTFVINKATPQMRIKFGCQSEFGNIDGPTDKKISKNRSNKTFILI